MFNSNFEHEKAMNLISSPSPSTYLLRQLSTGLPVPFATSQRQHTTDRSTCCWHQQSVFMSGPQEGLKIGWVGDKKYVIKGFLLQTKSRGTHVGEGGKQYAIKSHLLLTKSKGGMSPKSPGSFGPIFRLVPTTTIPYYLVHLMAPSIQGLLNELDISPIIHE